MMHISAKFYSLNSCRLLSVTLRRHIHFPAGQCSRVKPLSSCNTTPLPTSRQTCGRSTVPIWGLAQQRVCQEPVRDVAELKRHLIVTCSWSSRASLIKPLISHNAFIKAKGKPLNICYDLLSKSWCFIVTFSDLTSTHYCLQPKC